MKITTEGLTLGVIAGLETKGYKVEIEDDGLYANISKDATGIITEGFIEVGSTVA